MVHIRSFLAQLALLAAVLAFQIGCTYSKAEIAATVHKEIFVEKFPPSLSDYARQLLWDLSVEESLMLVKSAKEVAKLPSTEQQDPNKVKLLNKVPSNSSEKDARILKVLGTTTDVSALASVSDNTPADASNEGATETKNRDHFQGAGFGAGPSISIDVGGRKRVQDAEVLNGVVHVKESTSIVPRALLESHFFFPLNKATTMGMGPFVAVASGDGKALDALGLGVMNGYKLRDAQNALCFGVGIFWDPKVQSLAKGYEDGQAPPNSDTQVRYQTRSKTCLLITIAFTF